MNYEDAIIYHLYPLGALGAPEENDGRSESAARLRAVVDWIPAMERIGANVLLLGPVFESERHGYDTLDHAKVDRRLGSNDDLRALSAALHARGLSLALDAVLNHVGRGHPIVCDVVEKGVASPYAQWIAGFDPSRRTGGLSFAYDCWAGNYDLVKLDTGSEEVRSFLIGGVLRWIDEFDIDGIRLDAADCLDRVFLRELGARCRERKNDFFLFGEAVHGDHYRFLLGEGNLDSVTDYEAYKGLWSSYNDRNYHEIAWTLDRLFARGGLCEGKLLYSFADNHDVDRVASSLRDGAGLYPLYALLFAMPGVPSVYYGSEFGIEGKRTRSDDSALRPALDPAALASLAPHPDLAAAIARFAAARRASPAVRRGSYRTLAVAPTGLAFLRATGDDAAVVLVNGGDAVLAFDLAAPEAAGRCFFDLLDKGFSAEFDAAGRARVAVPSHWSRWLVPRGA